ncbi:putative ribonuclease H protein [Sesbania bispinosa]|nr:putative ribonuclease H protein [Sesbania bispinosa]
MDFLWSRHNYVVFKDGDTSSNGLGFKINFTVQQTVQSLMLDLCTQKNLSSNAISIIHWVPPLQMVGLSSIVIGHIKKPFCQLAVRVLFKIFGASLYKVLLQNWDIVQFTQAELCVILHGLRIAKDKAFLRIMVKSNSQIAIQFVFHGVAKRHSD